MNIRKANVEDASDCLHCIENSLLWDAYFKDDPTPKKIEEEIRKGRIRVAVDEQNRAIGFMGITEEACFGKFPYLAILSVHEKWRSRGVGGKLLGHFEKEGFAKENRVFILCSDFNERGRKFYSENGYTECGKIADLFKDGIAEHLFVKYKEIRRDDSRDRSGEN